MAAKIIISWIFIIGCYACYPRQKKSTIKVKSIFSEKECREYCESRYYQSYLYFFEESLMVYNPHDCHCSDNIYYHGRFKILWPQLRKMEKWKKRDWDRYNLHFLQDNNKSVCNQLAHHIYVFVCLDMSISPIKSLKLQF